MKENEWIVGFDLCAEYSQISYFDKEKMEPDSAMIGGMMRIPTVLCKLPEGNWSFGEAAQNDAGDKKGTLVSDFVTDLANAPMIKVAGKEMAKADLIAIFLEKSLEALKETLPEGEIGYLTVTTPKVDLPMAEAIKAAGAKLGIGPKCVAAQSHVLAYEYYALSQKRDLWTHDVGLFEYDRKGFTYHHLAISWRSHPASVTASEVPLNQYLNGSEIGSEKTEIMDQQFLAAILDVSARKTMSTYYLVGEGFDEDVAGNWMNRSLQQLCALRRHVFVGQNLYARGACYNSYYMADLEARPQFAAMNSDLLTKDIYIRSLHRRAPQKTILVGAGVPWYLVAGEKEIIVDGATELIIRVKDISGSVEQKTVLELPDLPKRPSKTTKLRIETKFDSESICHITATDIGFGEFFEATGKQWETTFDINGIPDVPVPAETGTIIETVMPATPKVLVMKTSGARVHSLEELCWYLQENVYGISMDMFDVVMMDWMDKIAGNRALSMAVQNYIRGERPLKDVVRLVLNSIDYLDNGEIGAVYNRLMMIEKQNPMEHAKMAADNFCRYGHYMAALKGYHHVLASVDPMKEILLIAATWHNMGVTFLKLHNMSSAVACLRKAWEIRKNEEYLKSLIFGMKMAGMEQQLLETAKDAGLDQEAFDALMQIYSQAGRDYEDSAHYVKLKNSLGEDVTFADKFVHEQKLRYDLV